VGLLKIRTTETKLTLIPTLTLILILTILTLLTLLNPTIGRCTVFMGTRKLDVVRNFRRAQGCYCYVAMPGTIAEPGF